MCEPDSSIRAPNNARFRAAFSARSAESRRARQQRANRQTAGTTFHPTSTCMMGPHENAVVDPALRVHGIGGLRVIDASIMPAVVSGNTNAAAIMIAEKGAEMIQNEARTAGSGVRARAA